ncbi:MAG: alpha-L-fucosidase C-terminal domain-containing protein [Isosphaeraceae bacterium]
MRHRKLDAPYRLSIRNITTSASTKATMLGVPRKLAITARDNSVTIRVPELTVETVPCRHAYTFKITESELMPE